MDFFEDIPKDRALCNHGCHQKRLAARRSQRMAFARAIRSDSLLFVPSTMTPQGFASLLGLCALRVIDALAGD